MKPVLDVQRIKRSEINEQRDSGAQGCTGVHRGAQGCTGAHRGAENKGNLKL